MKKDVLNFQYYLDIIKDDDEDVLSFDPYKLEEIELPFYSNKQKNLICSNGSLEVFQAKPKISEEKSTYELEENKEVFINNENSIFDHESIFDSGYLTSGFSFTSDSMKGYCDFIIKNNQHELNSIKSQQKPTKFNVPNVPPQFNSQKHQILGLEDPKQKRKSFDNKTTTKNEEESYMFSIASSTNRKCILISTQGKYQPSIYVFKQGEHSPRIHFFYFDKYTQSPFDIPPSNIQKYLMKQEETLITKEKKKFAHSSEEQNNKYCEFCH